MSERELRPRADLAISHSTALPTTKKLSKRTAGKQTVKQPAMKQNDQSSVQTSISSKMSKKLVQFFVSEFSKTSGSFKIKLEALMFKSKSESLSNEPDQSDNHQKTNSDDKD